MTTYRPQQGDIILLEFDPQVGHEQRGRRPAFVVSNQTFNHFTNLAIVCPITNSERRFPLHVSLDERTKTSGAIMCEQAKSLDLRARNACFLEEAPQDIIAEVIDILIASIEATN